MGAILRPYSNLLSPGIYQVPAGGLTIDWLNPLARGLIGCWLPGICQGRDITGKSTTLSAGVNVLFDQTSEGSSLRSSNASGEDGYSGLATAPYKFGSLGLSMHWRGTIIGGQVGGLNPTIIGITYDNAGGTPFLIASVGPPPNSDWISGLGVFWNTGGSLVFTSTVSYDASVNYGKVAGITLTFIPSSASNTVNLYVDGVLIPITTNSFGIDPPTSTATSSIAIACDPYDANRSPNIKTNLACFWDRVLTAQEALALHLDPYGLLLPAEYEMPIMQAQAADVIMGLHTVGASMSRIIRPIAYSPDR